MRKPLERDAMVKALREWAAEWALAPPFENEPLIRDSSRFQDQLELVIGHVQKGCLEDIEGVNYYRVLEETETGKYILCCLRGTNGNESTHTVIHGIVGQNSSIDTASYNTTLGLNRINFQAAIKRGDYSDIGHSQWWEAVPLNAVWARLYKQRRLQLPPSGLRMPFSYKHGNPLSPSCGVSAGEQACMHVLRLAHNWFAATIVSARTGFVSDSDVQRLLVLMSGAPSSALQLCLKLNNTRRAGDAVVSVEDVEKEMKVLKYCSERKLARAIAAQDAQNEGFERTGPIQPSIEALPNPRARPTTAIVESVPETRLNRPQVSMLLQFP